MFIAPLMAKPHMPCEVVLSTKALGCVIAVIKLTIESFTLPVMCLQVSVEVFDGVEC
jgi:hypothetical protein